MISTLCPLNNSTFGDDTLSVGNYQPIFHFGIVNFAGIKYNWIYLIMQIRKIEQKNRGM
jgi:hypothetical protein